MTAIAAVAVAVRLKPEEIREWKQHPATQLFLQDLRDRVDEGKGSWASQQYQKGTAEQTAVANAQALGGMQVLQTLIEFLEGEEE